MIQNDTSKHQTLIYPTYLTLTDMIRHLHGHARWGMIAAEPATAGSSMDGSSWGAVYLAGVCTWYHGYTTWDRRRSLSNTTNKNRVDETWNYRTVEQALSIVITQFLYHSIAVGVVSAEWFTDIADANMVFAQKSNGVTIFYIISLSLQKRRRETGSTKSVFAMVSGKLWLEVSCR